VRIISTVASLFLLLTCVVGEAASAGLVRWHPATATLDASLNQAPLSKVLSDIGAMTGWDVMVEPGMRAVVSTRFNGLTINQALRRILGGLNFAVLQGEREGTKKLYIYQRSIGAATQSLLAGASEVHPKSRRIENEIIVTLDPDSPETIEEIAARLGAEVVGKIDGMNAYRLRFKDAAEAEAARTTLASSDYLDVSDNFEVDLPSRLASLNFGSSAPPRVRVNPDPDQEHVVVGLIDTSVQAEGVSASEFLLPTLSVAGEANPPLNEPTHGTTMAETLLRGLEMVDDGGVGSNVRILPVDVYGSEEITSTFQVAAGVLAAVDAGASIINLSLGGQETTPFLQNLISDAHQQGVIFVGAAGNEPGTHNIFPAAYPEVVAVTSADRSGSVAYYANNGNFVDVMVPGHSYVNFNGETYLINGTSASAAYVSGITAGVAASTGLPLNQVEAQIRQTLPKPPEN
jgi:hypothetical protein